MLLVTAGAALRHQRAKRAPPGTGATPPGPARAGRSGPFGGALLVLLAFAIVVALAAVVSLARKSPHGFGDSLAIWNLRARFLFRGGEQWRDALSVLPWSHPDYPLLLPLSVTRLWKASGGETVAAPIALATLFFLAAVGVTAGAVGLLRSARQAALAGIVLLSAPSYLIDVTAQCADLPLGFFLLTTVVLVVIASRGVPGNPRLLALAGVAAGLAAWTKNEGLLVALAAAGAGMTVIGFQRAWRDALAYLRAFLAGLAPILLVVIAFKMIAPPSELVGSQNAGGILARLVDPSRMAIIARAFGEQLVMLGGWSIPLPLVPSLIAYLLVVGVDVPAEDRRGAAIGSGIVALMLAGYFFVYLTTPYDLAWHVTGSVGRLFLQLWPSIVFLFFLAARSPEVRAAGG
jgi:hypothetical protein